MRYLLGVDVGSSQCKAMIVSPEGDILASAERVIPTHYPRVGWAEQSPEDWYQAACATIRACLDRAGLEPDAVAALAVDGPAHNVALMDADGEVIYPCIHWSDLRSTVQSERLEALCGEQIFELSYTRVNPAWTLAQLLWLKENEPGVWSRLRKILVTKDYVRFRLTGTYQTDRYDAIGTQLYDVVADHWSADLCGLIDFPIDWLPPVAPAASISGTLSASAARDTGLLAGTPVAVGSGDSVVEALGIGVIEPGQGIVKLGTAANVDLVTERAYPSRQTITYRHVTDEAWFTIAATNSGTSTMRWFRETFCRHEMADAAARGLNGHAVIDDMAAGVPPGADGLLFHPYLSGERSPYFDPLLRGDFVGIHARHGLAHFARAILEGVAFSLRDCLEVVEALGQPVSSLSLIGGGARSRLWRQILCDVLGRPLAKPIVEDAAFGSALIAGIAAGVFDGWAQAVDACVRVDNVIQPDGAARAVYDDYFQVYQGVTRDISSYHHRLARLSTQFETVPEGD